MAKSAESKVGRIRKWREKRKLKRTQDGEKAQSAGRRPKAENEYDEDRLHRIGRGGLFG